VRRPTWTLLAAAVLGAGACGGVGPPADQPGAAEPPSASSVPGTPMDRPQPTEVTVTPSPSGPAPGPSDAAPGSATETAVLDLAARLGIEPDQVTVVRVEEVTWRDSSLGCPKPGRSYLQVLTDGQRIVLEAGGRIYEYHSGRQRAPFLCEDPLPRATDS
jgi:hypothetical protein